MAKKTSKNTKNKRTITKTSARSKASKKATAKSSSKTTKRISKTKRTSAAKKSTPAVKAATQTSGTPSKTIFSKQLTMILIGIALILAAYFFKGLYIAALVNGQPVSRLFLIREMEKAIGQRLLEQEINEMLIWQEAGKQNVTVTDAEIEEGVKEFEARLQGLGQDLDSFLEMQGSNKQELEENVKLQKTVEKLLVDKTQVTEEEIDQYLETNKEMLPEIEDATQEAQLRETTRQSLEQQKLNQSFEAWLGEVKTTAKIKYFVEY